MFVRVPHFFSRGLTVFINTKASDKAAWAVDVRFQGDKRGQNDGAIWPFNKEKAFRKAASSKFSKLYEK